jgi:hypothetical protein
MNVLELIVLLTFMGLIFSSFRRFGLETISNLFPRVVSCFSALPDPTLMDHAGRFCLCS